jgi:hypothetical protein
MTENSSAFYCPHCGTGNPGYTFLVGSGRNLQMDVNFVTVICLGKLSDEIAATLGRAECRRILPVTILDLKVHVRG